MRIWACRCGGVLKMNDDGCTEAEWRELCRSMQTVHQMLGCGPCDLETARKARAARERKERNVSRKLR